jgi:ankyrin repeat protein
MSTALLSISSWIRERAYIMATTASPSADEIREFVIAGHGNLEKVKNMLAEKPALLNLSYEWRPDDTETALQGAAHVGSRPVAEYLLSQGAPLDICTAAMLGQEENVEYFLQRDPSAINTMGAHGISLLTHATLSGDVKLVEMLFKRGATTGSSLALNIAVSRGDVKMCRWLLKNAAPDLYFKNFQGKTALEIATENGSTELADLLKAHGADS